MKYATWILAALLLVVMPLSGQLAVSHASNATGAQPAQAPAVVPTGRPVARVNGTVLTDTDLLREMYAIFPYARQHGGFPAPMEADIRNGAMKMIVFEELVYQEALRRKMSVSPARLDKAEREFRKQFRTPDQYQMYLKNECKGSRQVLRARVRRSLLIDDLLNAEVTKKAAVTTAQAKTFYEKNPDKFRVPESVAVQTISVLPPNNATPQQVKDARKRAEDDLRQAKATKSYEEFGLLAEKISEDDYRVMMGDHRAVDIAKLPPEIGAALRSLQPGQVTDLVQVGQVYTIVRLNARTPAGTLKFQDVKNRLRQGLEKNKTEQLRSELNAKLRKNAKVEEL